MLHPVYSKTVLYVGRTPRLQRRNLQDLRPLTSLTRLTLAAVEDRPLSLPRAGLLQALAPLTGLRQLDIDILALDNTTAASLRHFTNLEYLSVGQLQAKTSLRALQVLPCLQPC